MTASVTMTAAERVKLLDAAMRSSDPRAYLDGVHGVFEDTGRSDDAVLAMVLHALLQTGEIEMLMFMRAEWCGLRSGAPLWLRRSA